MFKDPEALIPLWDYGWCEHRIIEPSIGSEDVGVVENYLSSPQFGTSFIYPEPGENPELHGPFLRSAIRVSHFEPIPMSEVLPALRRICYESPDSILVTSEQWNELERLANEVLMRNELAYRLLLTVQDTEIQHEWGWVILDFHEFIFANTQSQQIERLVIGYD